jgi:hypothetical protein
MLRYRRIITSDKEFQEKAQNPRVALIGRGYKDKDILPHINKASSYTQSQLLINTTQKQHTNITIHHSVQSRSRTTLTYSHTTLALY